MLAINPANPRNLVGGSKFFTDSARYRFQIGTYTSFDGGCAWTDNGVLPGFPPSETTSDVTIAFGPDNLVYVAVLYTDNARDSGIAVSTSTDGGKTFGQPVRVFDDLTGTVFSDKPWLTLDMSSGPHRGSVYVVWSYDFGGSCGFENACKQGVGFARSTDGGGTFSAARQVEGAAPFCTNPAPGRSPDDRTCDAALGAVPAVLPDGTLAVAYDYMDVTSSGKIPTRLAVITSPDGGATWTSPVLIVTISDILALFLQTAIATSRYSPSPSMQRMVGSTSPGRISGRATPISCLPRPAIRGGRGQRPCASTMMLPGMAPISSSRSLPSRPTAS